MTIAHSEWAHIIATKHYRLPKLSITYRIIELYKFILSLNVTSYVEHLIDD